MRCRLPLDHDVDDRVQPRLTRERGPEAALVHDDRARVALAVEDARYQPLLAEAAHAAGADLVGPALRDLESDTIARHRRTMVAEVEHDARLDEMVDDVLAGARPPAVDHSAIGRPSTSYASTSASATGERSTSSANSAKTTASRGASPSPAGRRRRSVPSSAKPSARGT